MAVEIKYVVVRKGEEKMTFASKKEADAYDKMLDMAEVFCDWLSAAPLAMEEDQREALGMFLAEHKDAVQHIVRTSKMPEAATEGTASSVTVSEEPESEAVSAGVDEETPSSAKAKGPRAVKAA